MIIASIILLFVLAIFFLYVTVKNVNTIDARMDKLQRELDNKSTKGDTNSVFVTHGNSFVRQEIALKNLTDKLEALQEEFDIFTQQIDSHGYDIRENRERLIFIMEQLKLVKKYKAPTKQVKKVRK